MCLKEIKRCSYCNKIIDGFINKSRLNNAPLCDNCYYGEMFSITMSKIIKESDDSSKK